jgi:hypothetical protein
VRLIFPWYQLKINEWIDTPESIRLVWLHLHIVGRDKARATVLLGLEPVYVVRVVDNLLT